MKIWELKSDFNGYESIQLVNFDEDFDRYFDTRFPNPLPLLSNWEDVYVKTIEKEAMRARSDFPHFWVDVGTSVVSEKAKVALQGLVKNSVEFLPLIHDEYQYYAIHVLKIIDAIDYKKAVLKRLSSGFVIGFDKYEFIKERVLNQHIFKVYLNDNIHRTATFVSDVFRDLALESELTGANFVEVWDSESNY
ncbi:imm11 family protein [Ectobacillus panaciterrae]|uniref:imm11 family protein n=1 Tax=Ectobacillus panaciterrae TaxID=363872 RepID=UPI0004140EDF|nr:DUF1629 domain-containing protein [Ectobacillus panaciterrae]